MVPCLSVARYDVLSRPGVLADLQLSAGLPTATHRDSAWVILHRAHQSRAHARVDRRGQLLVAEPSDVVVFLRSLVGRPAVPVTHDPRAEERRYSCRTCGPSTQMGRRACRYPHPELFVQLPRERDQLRLARLHEPTGQVPHSGVRALVGSTVHEEDPATEDQCAEDDLVHARIRARASDTSGHTSPRGARPDLAAIRASKEGPPPPRVGRTDLLVSARNDGALVPPRAPVGPRLLAPRPGL